MTMYKVAQAHIYHLRSLRYLRCSLTFDVVNTLVVLRDRIDYCNTLLVRASIKKLNRLQPVQNGLARAVFYIGIRKLHGDGRTYLDLLYHLHWLSIKSRIRFKIDVLCFKSNCLWMLSYLASFLQPYKPMHTLRSSNHDQLTVPSLQIKHTSRRFSAADPQVRNELPMMVRMMVCPMLRIT